MINTFRSLLLLAACLVAQAGFSQVSPAGDASRRSEGVPFRSANATVLRTDAMMEEKPGDEFVGFAPASAGDRDIGDQMILRERERKSDFSFNADAFLFWTNNAAHVAQGEQGDTFLGLRAEAAWMPRIVGNLFGGVSVSQDWVRYDRFDALDFETFQVTPGIAYVEPRLGNTSFYAQYQYERLTHDWKELMNRHAVRAGIVKTWVFNRRSSIDTGVMGSWDFDNDVDSLRRNEYAVTAAWRFKITHKLEMALQYSYTFFDYTELDRQDHLHVVGLSFDWRIRKWLSAYAYLSYAFNDSNLDVYDYQAANLGGGIGLRLKF